METSIKALVMDVDGTLTDGKIYIGSRGEEFKVFNIKDGYGIHRILPEHNIKTVIMTGRESDLVSIRAKELEIDYVFQNIKNKKDTIEYLTKELKCNLSQIAYIGDDLIDIPAMELCGIKGCPADAAYEVQIICDYVSTKNGGYGAVRDFIEWMINRKIVCTR